MSKFIETLAPYAIQHGTAANVLPSLIVAQGVLESGSGTSSLAKNANNLFGIKKGGSWTGETYAVVTGEYRKNSKGEDEYYEVVAEFRKYPSYEGAVLDLVEKYSFGLKGESRNRYEAVLGQRDFAKAAQAVKDAGYATDPKYPEKLINIYNTYNLSQYDDVTNIPDIVDIIEENKEETEMAYKVAVDAGHGINTAGKRTPAGEREWTFNNMVVVALIAELKTYSNVEVLRVDDPTGKTDVGLSARARKANNWGADIYISVHHNANTGKWGTWTGTETYVMSGSTSSSGSMKLANLVHSKLVSAMGLRNRGIKAANFAVLRETKMPAILTEGGYMDSTIDIKKMRNATVMKNAGKSIATGAAAYFGAKKKSGSTPVSNPSTDPMAKGYLAEGDAGSSVKKLQQDLNKISVVTKASKITEDGAFGPATLAAVRKFQSYFLLEVDGFYGVASQAKMKSELAKLAKPVTSSDLYRVRKSWTDAASQLGAFSELSGAIDIAKAKSGYKVYDSKGKQVYPQVASKPSTTKLYRVRKSWSNEESQIGAFSDLNGAKDVADKNKGYYVFDENGKKIYPVAEAIERPKYSMKESERLGEVVMVKDWPYRVLPDNSSEILYELKKGHKCHYYEVRGDFYRLGQGWVYKSTVDVLVNYKEQAAEKAKKAEEKAKAEAEAAKAKAEAEKVKAEAEEQAILSALLSEAEKAHTFVGLIVINGETDIVSAYDLHMYTGYPVVTKAKSKQHKAKHIIVIGGGIDNFDKQADIVTLLSGKTAEDTAKAVKNYLKQ